MSNDKIFNAIKAGGHLCDVDVDVEVGMKVEKEFVAARLSGWRKGDNVITVENLINSKVVVRVREGLGLGAGLFRAETIA